jgi:hypothetical protein
MINFKGKEGEESEEFTEDDFNCEVSMPFAIQHNVHVDFSSSTGFKVRLMMISSRA